MPPDSKFAGDSGREAPKKAPKTGAAEDSRGASQADSRKQRQAQALRDNLKKRKAQQRQRQGGGA